MHHWADQTGVTFWSDPLLPASAFLLHSVHLWIFMYYHSFLFYKHKCLWKPFRIIWINIYAAINSWWHSERAKWANLTQKEGERKKKNKCTLFSIYMRFYSWQTGYVFIASHVSGMCTFKLACSDKWALSSLVLHMNDLFGTLLLAKGPRKQKKSRNMGVKYFPVLSGQLVNHLEKVRSQWKRQASHCNITVC